MVEDNIKTHYIISFLTEFVGTGILMWIGCAGCLWTYNLGPTVPAFTFGMAITSAIQTFGHISPIHINPAVSLGLLILGRMHWKRFFIYLLGQYTGAMAGFGLLIILLPRKHGLCVLKVNKEISVIQGFFIEFMTTLVLMLAVAGATDGPNEEFKDSISLRLGLIVVGLVFAVEPFTGAGLNSARSLPPAVYYNEWKDHWVYELAPLCGMATAAIMYRFLFDDSQKYSLRSAVDKEKEPA